MCSSARLPCKTDYQDRADDVLHTRNISLLKFVCAALPCTAQVSHVSTECDYPLGVEAKDMIEDEWAVSQACFFQFPLDCDRPDPRSGFSLDKSHFS